MKTYVSIVLDKSGSMEWGRKETVTGFNEQIQAIKNGLSENNETIVSLITFNDSVTPVFAKPADMVEELKFEDYKPNGCTAMYDGVGFAIEELLKLDDINNEDTSVLMVIISDGWENASKNVKKEDLAEKIQSLTSTERWTFTYLGANQDLSKVAEDLKFDIRNMGSFSTASSEDFTEGYTCASNSISRYMSIRSTGASAVQDFYADSESEK